MNRTPERDKMTNEEKQEAGLWLLSMDIFKRSYNIEVARLASDYDTEKLLKKAMLNQYGKGGRLTVAKRIATDGAKRTIKAKGDNAKEAQIKLTVDRIAKALFAN